MSLTIPWTSPKAFLASCALGGRGGGGGVGMSGFGGGCGGVEAATSWASMAPVCLVLGGWEVGGGQDGARASMYVTQT